MIKVFDDFIQFILSVVSANNKFVNMTNEVKQYISSLDKSDFLEIVMDIGAIPEQIEASSTGEKLFSKASDIVLARCFQELGLKAIAITERKNSADIQADSIHGYTLVADAKTFRLSRTAKNQKDFKISNLSKWRGMENEFAVLVAPYYQYPNTNSQIYSSALDESVCLLSWEHIIFLLKHEIKEDISFSLEQVWNSSTRIVRDSKITFADRMNYLFPHVNKMVCDRIGVAVSEFDKVLESCKKTILMRSDKELSYLNNEISIIKQYSKEEAIKELIKSKKINEKIRTINDYMKSLT